MTRKRGVLIGLLVVALLASPPPPASASGTSDAAVGAARTQTTPAAEELAQRYAPIVYLKEQEEDCDSNGEAYAPVEVEIVLDKPAVALMLATDDGDELVMEAPSASDLYDKGEGYYLDYPGDPRQPGCNYERDFKARSPDYANVAYASIRTEPGHSEIALQYWFFFYFNDWNNTHEADWEMIQLVFEAGTVEEALQQEPTRVAYAQHASGERAGWDDDKLQKEDGRPVVYVAAGGHPSQFDDAVYFGLGEDGAGFGCDDTSTPSLRVPLEARLIPDNIAGSDDPFAWIEYGGQWGEKDVSHWNGPTGPAAKGKWNEPFTWEDGLRESSVKVPGGTTLAPNAIEMFCRVVSFGSSVLNLYTRAPLLVIATTGLVFLGVAGVTYMGRTRSLKGMRPLAATASQSTPLRRERDLWQLIRAAGRTYRHNWTSMLLIGAFYVPIGWITSIVHPVLTNSTPLEPLWRILDEYPATEIVVTLFLGGTQAAVAVVIVTSAVVVVLRQIEEGRRGDAVEAYLVVWDKVGTLAGAYGRAAIQVILFTITVVGIPLAVQRVVRWYFLPQTVMLEEKTGMDALASSADVVQGSWWRAFGLTFLFGFVGFVTGPAVAIFFLLFAGVSVTFANLVSTIIYIVLIPYVATAVTLLYYDLKTRRGS